MSAKVRNGIVCLTNQHGGLPIWIGAKHIKAMFRVAGETGWTEVTLGDDLMYDVRETPEEIHALIEEAEGER